MTSQAHTIAPLAGVRGLAFLAFPLHPAGKPSSERARHFADIRIPLLFLQATRDALADLKLLEPVVESLGQTATLHLVKEADHSFCHSRDCTRRISYRHIPRMRAPTSMRGPWLGARAAPATATGQTVFSNRPSRRSGMNLVLEA
jgi:predicted alpha/beta-hydrolase family hydrolase